MMNMGRCCKFSIRNSVLVLVLIQGIAQAAISTSLQAGQAWSVHRPTLQEEHASIPGTGYQLQSPYESRRTSGFPARGLREQAAPGVPAPAVSPGKSLSNTVLSFLVGSTMGTVSLTDGNLTIIGTFPLTNLTSLIINASLTITNSAPEAINITSPLINGTRLVINGSFPLISGSAKSTDNESLSNATTLVINGTLVVDNDSASLQNGTVYIVYRTSPESHHKSSKGFPSWLIAVIACGGLFMVLVLGFLTWMVQRSRSRGKRDSGSRSLIGYDHWDSQPTPPKFDRPEISEHHAPSTEVVIPLELLDTEVIREEDLPPQKLLITAKQAYGAIAIFADRVLKRLEKGKPQSLAALLKSLDSSRRTELEDQQLARALIEKWTSHALLDGFDDPGFKDEALSAKLDKIPYKRAEQSRFFRAIFETANSSNDVFSSYMSSRAQTLLNVFQTKLSDLSSTAARNILLGPSATSGIFEREFVNAALLTFLLHAAAFSYESPATAQWAPEGKRTNAGLFSSYNARTEDAKTGISIFPAIVLASNTLERGTVFSLRP